MTRTPHQVFALGDLPLECGVTLPDAKLAYVTYGTLNAAGDNAIVVPTWYIGTHADVEFLIGDGKPLDTARHVVVVMNMFASGLSSSPSNTPPPFDRARFPAIDIRDNVRAQKLLVDHLGIRKIRLAFGGSMGAFQVYQWGLSHPDLVERVLASCGASRCSPHAYVFLAGASAALLADPAYSGGDYAAQPEAGMRAMARVWAGWALSQEFYRDALHRRMGFDDLDTFLVNFWEAFWLGCDANDLLNQLRTWQTADLARTPGFGGDLAKALGAIRAKVVCTPGRKDLYFPPEDMADEVALMKDAELRVIEGPWGHFSEVGVDAACTEQLSESIRLLLAR